MNEVGITSKKGRHALDDARSVNGTALKVLHDIQEAIVNIGVIGELYLDLIKVA